MPSLSQFNDFVLATGAKVATSPDRIVNDATLNTYMLARMLKGRGAAQSVQSGAKIIDRVMLTDSGTAEFFSPNDDLDIQNVDNLVPIEIEWRFVADHFAYTEQEVTFNSGDPQTYYKNLLKGKRQATATSMFNKMEAALWSQPSNSGMESDSGKLPYSIPAFITHNANGSPTGFSTVETLSAANNAGWRNQRETYDPSNLSDPQTGIMHAMDRMWHKVKFVSPRTQAEYFESDMLQKMVIATNLDGVTILQQITRSNNDRAMVNGNLRDNNGLTYAGIPIEYVATLDTALVNDGAVIPSGQPWFYYINLSFLYPIFHSDKYMLEKEPMQHPRQPFSYVVWSRTYYNLFCLSRRRQGIIVAA